MSSLPSHKRRHDKRLRRGIWAVVLSTCFHLLLVAFFLVLSFVELKLPGFEKAKKAPPPSAIKLRSLTNDQWAANREKSNKTSKLAQQKTAPKEKPKFEKPPEGQIVDVAPGNNEQNPDAKFIAETSNRVKKETKAKEQTAFYRNAMPKRSATQPSQGSGQDDAKSPQVSGNNGQGNDERPMATAPSQQIEIPTLKRQSQIALKQPTQDGPGPTVSNQPEREEIAGNGANLNLPHAENSGSSAPSQGRLGAPGTYNLVPSTAVVDKLTGAAPNDHLKDIPEGDGTYLNTREWKFASFFNRVRQRVGMSWDPVSVMRVRDPSGEIYGGRDRHTVLAVTLTSEGGLKDVYVEKSCGIDFLDLEAIRSFERAQPFPNPPPGLLEGKTQVSFRFGFFLEMGGPRMGLFRMGN